MALLCEYISPTGGYTGQGWPLEEAAAPLDMHFSIPNEQFDVAEHLLVCFLTSMLCVAHALCSRNSRLTSLPFASMPAAARLPRLPRLSNVHTILPILQQNFSITSTKPLT